MDYVNKLLFFGESKNDLGNFKNLVFFIFYTLKIGTQEDKDRLGFLAIKKLHENMDDDRDGQVEVKETKEVGFLFV